MYALKEVRHLPGIYMAEIGFAQEEGCSQEIIDGMSKRLDELMEAIGKLEDEAQSILDKYSI